MRISITLICALSACAPDVAERDAHTVIDSAGIAIVESFAPQWGDSARIDPEPLVRIGREEAGPYQFAFISHARLLSDGTIAVADFSSSSTLPAGTSPPWAAPVKVRASSGASRSYSSMQATRSPYTINACADSPSSIAWAVHRAPSRY
jgi:hypothetical protein